MLTPMFELRIDWYTNKGQCSSIKNEMIYSGILIRRSVAQWDSTELLNILYRSAAQRDRAGDSVILRIESFGYICLREK